MIPEIKSEFDLHERRRAGEQMNRWNKFLHEYGFARSLVWAQKPFYFNRNVTQDRYIRLGLCYFRWHYNYISAGYILQLFHERALDMRW